jgi:hypothetical protein
MLRPLATTADGRAVPSGEVVHNGLVQSRPAGEAKDRRALEAHRREDDCERAHTSGRWVTGSVWDGAMRP